MAQLIVRKLNDRLVRRLKRRAAQHGISTEEEHRRILREILEPKEKLKPKMNFKEFLLTVPDFGEDADAYRKKAKWREMDLD